jgi:hypothetical protein
MSHPFDASVFDPAIFDTATEGWQPRPITGPLWTPRSHPAADWARMGASGQSWAPRPPAESDWTQVR